MTVVSPRVGRGSIVIGIIELVTTGICVIVGIIQVVEHSDDTPLPGYSMLAYVIPGGLSIMAGRTRNVGVMAVAVFSNTAALVFATLAALFNVAGYGFSAHYGDDQGITIFAVLTVIISILGLTSFAGTILGCVGICFRTSEATVVTTTPTHQSIVSINTQNTAKQENPAEYPMVCQNTANCAVQYYTNPPA